MDIGVILAATAQEPGLVSWLLLKVLAWFGVLAGLTFVIFVHELGHFLVAKACGVKCEKFYVGFDFFEFIYAKMSPADKQSINQMTTVKFIPDLIHHGHAPNVTRQLIERGYSDADIEKVLYGNWMRVLAEVI